MNLDQIPWPPPYKVRKHRLARSVKLIASKTQGLVITIPPRFSLKHLPAIIEEHKSWIIAQLSQVHLQQEVTLPNRITFPALPESWAISYQPCRGKLEMIVRPQQEVVLVGDTNNIDKCRLLLREWVKERANIFLREQLCILSTRMQLPFSALSIRDQKTLWGSCTVNHAISLNYKLIFLSAELVDYVLIHELAHTKHLNHGKRFWQLVEQFDPEWHTHRRMLRKADEHIPSWCKF